jgi:hypothetical protein
MDARLGIKGSHSAQLQREMVWLSVTVPYGKAAEVFSRIGQLELSDSTLWERVQRVAKATQPAALTPLTTQKSGGSDKMGIAIDGCMVNIREEAWKEAKIAAVFEVVASDAEAEAACVNTSYVTHLGGPEGLSNQLAAEARAREYQKASNRMVIGDGADWIWNIAETDYPGAAQINDWYHASQHVHAAARLLFTEQSAEYDNWVDAQKSVLYAGLTTVLAQEIRQRASTAKLQHRQALLTEAEYFSTRTERMQYQDFRNAGFPIGSGVIEGYAKTTKQRFSGPGMRWSRAGITNLMPFAAAEASGSFNAYWERRCP